MTTLSIKLEDINKWREDWLAAYGSDDGTDQVTPFDQYLYSAKPSSGYNVPVSVAEAIEALDVLSEYFHKRSKDGGWWLDPLRDKEGHIVRDSDGRPVLTDMSVANDPIFDGIKLALIMTEGAEALEALRTGAMDDKLPQFTGVATELADVLIRVFDTAGKRKLKMSEVVFAKDAYNGIRPDHKPEARFNKPNGKAF